MNCKCTTVVERLSCLHWRHWYWLLPPHAPGSWLGRRLYLFLLIFHFFPPMLKSGGKKMSELQTTAKHPPNASLTFVFAPRAVVKAACLRECANERVACVYKNDKRVLLANRGSLYLHCSCARRLAVARQHSFTGCRRVRTAWCVVDIVTMIPKVTSKEFKFPH